MLEAGFWGAVGASTLLFGALIAYFLMPGRRVIAVVMALGTGLLIGSVSFELIDEALKTSTVAWVGLLLLVGAAVCAVGSRRAARDVRGHALARGVSGRRRVDGLARRRRLCDLNCPQCYLGALR
jgi:ZIP family zinc transporter